MPARICAGLCLGQEMGGGAMLHVPQQMAGWQNHTCSTEHAQGGPAWPQPHQSTRFWVQRMGHAWTIVTNRQHAP